MKISLSLLKKFIDLELSPKEIAEKLTLLGLEVDGIIHETPPFSGVVAAEITHAEKHPHAEKLNLLKVFDGKDEWQIVCGDRSTKKGMKVALAKIGAELTDAKGVFKIQKVKLRQIESFGMLCTAKELGLYDDHAHVLTLDDSVEVGQDLKEAFWDPIFEISLTPNLGHSQSAYGVARDLSALLRLKLKQDKMQEPKQDSQIKAKVLEGSPRYSLKAVENIQVGSSPFWLKLKLEEAGFNSINNVVDVTNYVMLLFGQPLHAFDRDRIEGNITVKKTCKPFTFLGLDQKERDIEKDALVIEDEKKVIALAGVMGGDNTAVSEKTKNILLEAAYFDSKSVRKTSHMAGIRTESSMRFEKGTDPFMTFYALEYAAQLLKEISHAKPKAETLDIKQEAFEPKKIDCRQARVEKILGAHISLNEMDEIFKNLGFKTRLGDGIIHVRVPYFRHDVTSEIDLIEEVARIYGYNHIEKKKPLFSTSNSSHHKAFNFEKEMRTKAISLGLTQVMTPDLISPDLAKLGGQQILQVLHSKSEDHSVLRSTLLPSLLQVVQHNQDRGIFDLSLFEIGKVHFKKQEKFFEDTMLGIILTGKETPPSWTKKPVGFTLFDLKGVIENLFHSVRLKPTFNPSDHEHFHPTRQGMVELNGQAIGVMGEVHPNFMKTKYPIYYAEINLAILQKLMPKEFKMKTLPQFPSSQRDWTLNIQKDLPFEKITKALNEIEVPLLERISLIDIFSPEKASEKHNVTLRFVYRDKEKTLSFEEVEKAHAHLTKIISEKLGCN